MLITTHAIENLVRRVLVIILNVTIVILSIVGYRYFANKFNPELDGLWVTACNDKDWGRKDVSFIWISNHGATAETFVNFRVESCGDTPMMLIHSKQALSKGKDSLPEVLLFKHAKVMLMMTTDMMAGVANVLKMWGHKDWKKGEEQDITGKHTCWLSFCQDMPAVGEVEMKQDLLVDYYGNDSILISNTRDGVPVVLNRLKEN